MLVCYLLQHFERFLFECQKHQLCFFNITPCNKAIGFCVQCSTEHPRASRHPGVFPKIWEWTPTSFPIPLLIPPQAREKALGTRLPARAFVVLLGYSAEIMWQEINCFKIDSPTRGERIPLNAHKAGNWYLYVFMQLRFRRAPPYLEYWSSPGCKSHRVYIGFSFVPLSTGSYFPH